MYSYSDKESILVAFTRKYCCHFRCKRAIKSVFCLSILYKLFHRQTNFDPASNFKFQIYASPNLSFPRHIHLKKVPVFSTFIIALTKHFMFTRMAFSWRKYLLIAVIFKPMQLLLRSCLWIAFDVRLLVPITLWFSFSSQLFAIVWFGNIPVLIMALQQKQVPTAAHLLFGVTDSTEPTTSFLGLQATWWRCHFDNSFSFWLSFQCLSSDHNKHEKYLCFLLVSS